MTSNAAAKPKQEPVDESFSDGLPNIPLLEDAVETFGLGFELKGGPYLPAIGNETGGAEGVRSFEVVFGSNPNPLYTIGADLQLYRGVGTLGIGASFWRDNPARALRPSVKTVTSSPAAASASARASVWTTPPRGRVEYVRRAIFTTGPALRTSRGGVRRGGAASGGPGRSTELFSLYAYVHAFLNLDLGRGSAAAIIGGLIILVIGVVLYRLVDRIAKA